ncbi:MAG: hypothetical protein J7521_00670 [Caulobacter sp.]|nr:hypothetical protein [Caulobacter sp.]
MSEALLYPRLAVQGVKVILDDVASLSLDWTDRRLLVSKWTSHAATGGRRVSDEELSQLRSRIVELATGYGFPERQLRNLSPFDIELTKALFDEDLVAGPEAMNDEVWSFIAAVLVPDVVSWRFGATTERYRGGVRNALQRLWLRGASFRKGSGEDRWEIVESLSEDANLQILERPSLAGSPAVARAIGEEWLLLYRRPMGSALENVMRRTAITLRITNQVLYLASLDYTALRAEVAEHFRQAAGE